MEFDGETLKRIKVQLGDTTKLIEGGDLPKLWQAEERLSKLTYELETLAAYASSLPQLEVKEVGEHVDTIQAELAQRIEAGNIPRDALERLVDVLSRLGNVYARLGYYLSK